MQEIPFVARERELTQLESYLQGALAGNGRVCFVSGQAGAGKSALLGCFVEQALRAKAELVAAMGECNAQTGIGDPYLPFREALVQLTSGSSTKHTQGAGQAENSRRLRTAVAHSVRILVDVAPDLVGLMIPGGRILGSLAKAVAENAGLLDDLERLMQRKGQAGAMGSMEQARLFEQYAAFLEALAKERPLVLVLDDLQWADAASIALLFYLGRRIGQHRILVVGTYRPDDVALGRNGERHPLEAALNEFKRYFGEAVVDLDQTTVDRGEAFVEALLDRRAYAVSDEFCRALYHQTNGHALFTVETLRSMQETGALVLDAQGRWVEGPDLAWSLMPARVEGVIEERIARLEDDVREMLRVASVEGEQFTAEVIATVRQVDARSVVRELSNEVERQHHLVRAEGLRQVRERRLSLYRFMHNMTHRYLYGTLGEAERVYLHEDVGKLLETWFADSVDEIAVQLAHHFEQSGDTFRAVRYLLLAGNRARRMSAYEEAHTHLTRGLELVQRFPEDSLERMAFELALQATLGATLIAIRGYAAEEVGRAFASARELCRAMSDPPQVIPVLYGLCQYYLVRGETRAAQEEGERVLALAEMVGDRDYVLGGHVLLALTSSYLGELEPACRHCEQVMALYRPDADRDLGFQQGQDPAVVALSYHAWLLWLLGYPDQATAKETESLAVADRAGHPFSQALALNFAAISDYYRRDWPTAQAHAEQALAIAQREHFPFWEAMALHMLGTAIARRGQQRAGMALMQQGMDGWERAGARLGVPMFALSLAELCLEVGNTERALVLIERSIQDAKETEQGPWQADQHRLRGEILVRLGNVAEATASMQKAVAIAREQKARMLELRAAICLAELPQSPVEQDQARQDLARIYASFAPGLEAPELARARELLG